MNSISNILLCIVFLVVQREINAINCYVCGFGTDGCGPSFSKTGSGVLQTNDSQIKYCVKDVASSNKNAISRTHNTTDECISGNHRSDLTGITYDRYCCDTDLCNEALIRKASLILAVISAAIGALLIK